MNKAIKSSTTKKFVKISWTRHRNFEQQYIIVSSREDFAFVGVADE